MMPCKFQEIYHTTVESSSQLTTLSQLLLYVVIIDTLSYNRLAMNRIIDIPDTSNDSHMDLFNSQQQQQILDSLSMKRLERTACKINNFNDIIEKV